MDARAEAEKRWRDDTDDLRNARTGFLAGAAWALREFGDLLDEAGAVAMKEGLRRDGVKMLGWASEAHHIADGIESDE